MKLPTTEELNCRVRFRLRTEAPNSFYGVDEILDQGRLLWAKVDPVHGLSNRTGMQTAEVPTHLIWVRYTPSTRPQNFTASHVLDHQGRRYRVLDAIDVGNRHRYTRVSVKDLGEISK